MTNSPSYIDARLNNRATVRLQLERRRNTHAFDTTDPTTRKGDTTTTTTSTSTTTKTTATMVYYFKSRCGDFLIYMGKDKYENEDLIKYGLPEDVWFHVDDLSSAHVYLRMKPGMTMDDISEDLLLDCSALVKANSIQGCKKSEVYVVYTRWKNLKKTAQMVDGQVGFFRPDNVRRVKVEKNNSIVRQIEKTKEEAHPDLYQLQQDRLQEIQKEKKANYIKQQKALRIKQLQEQQEKELKSYDRLFENTEQMTSVSDQQATADSTAAEEYEDDFF